MSCEAKSGGHNFHNWIFFHRVQDRSDPQRSTPSLQVSDPTDSGSPRSLKALTYLNSRGVKIRKSRVTRSTCHDILPTHINEIHGIVLEPDLM